ncbi:MAG: thioredoxin family protein [Candidatus Obscuribacterales bacterium]|nr:thioredoxin family protein [Candidatus Obscuribacterales bacterium]
MVDTIPQPKYADKTDDDHKGYKLLENGKIQPPCNDNSCPMPITEEKFKAEVLSNQKSKDEWEAWKKDHKPGSNETFLPGNLPKVELYDSKAKNEPGELKDFRDIKSNPIFLKGQSTIDCHRPNQQNDFKPFDFSQFGAGKKNSDLLNRSGAGPDQDKESLRKFFEQIVKPENKPENKPETKPEEKPKTEEGELRSRGIKIDPNVDDKPKENPENKEEGKLDKKADNGAAKQEKEENKQEKAEDKQEKAEDKNEKAEDKNEKAEDKNEKVEPKSEFQRKIEATGAYTLDNIQQAYDDAAKNGAGVAMVILGENTPHANEMLDNLSQLQKENPNLRFVVINKDDVAAKAAANPDDKSMQSWKGWIDGNLKDCNGQPFDYPFTSVQSLTAGPDGKPRPEKVTSTHWGTDISAGLQDQAQYAAGGTRRNANLFSFKNDQEPSSPSDKVIKPSIENQNKTEPKPEPRKEPESESKVDPKPEPKVERESAKIESDKPKKTVFDGSEYKEALKEAKEHKLPVVIKVGTSWCGPCQNFEADLAQGKLGNSLDGKAVVIKVDADRNPSLARGVGSYPTFKTGYVNDQGNLVITNQFANYSTPSNFNSSVQRGLNYASQRIR